MGWLMLYAGATKVFDPNWSAAGYLKGAKTFAFFYQGFLNPGVLPIINFINEWGLTLLGVSLILGIGVRLTSLGGAAIMILYYFPILQFPLAGTHSYIIDEHIIYALVLVFLSVSKSGTVWWGLEEWFANLVFGRKHPKLREWLDA